jgi:CHAD domain-containing protein
MLQAVEEGDPRAVHRTRVASRRLREVLPVLPLDPDVVARLTKKLRKITRHLGSVRELDVLTALIEELKADGRHSEAALTRINNAVTEARGRARERRLSKNEVRELHRVAAKLARAARSLEEPDRHQDRRGRAKGPGALRACRWAIQARIGRRAALLARAIGGAGTVYLPERLHAVRIAVKKLRYALELDIEAANVKSSPDLSQLRRVQDVLGRLHDLQVLIDKTREEQASLTPPDINVWRELDALVFALENDCRRLHGRYMHEAPALAGLCSRLAGRTEPVRARSQKARVTRG